MKKLSQGIPSIVLLSAALLFGNSTPDLCAAKESESVDEIVCTTCCTPYNQDSILIQQDCNHPENLHFCLPCSMQMVTSNLSSGCALCRSTIYKIHDPRVRKDSYTYVHHRQKPLDAQEQGQLRRYLMSVGNRISLKAAPDTLMRQCSSCNHTVDKDQVVIELGCGHNLCLHDAAKRVKNNTMACPICKNGPVIITDPLEMSTQNRVALKYLQRAPTQEEATLLQKVRSAGRLFQEHIAVDKRVAVEIKRTPKKPTPIQKRPQDPVKHNRPEAPIKSKQDLKIVTGTYPLTELSEEDIRLNQEHLPQHLDPQKWQVIIVPSQTGKGNEFARIKRVKGTSKPVKTSGGIASTDEKDPEEEKVPDLFKGYTGDLIAGLCIGLLIGQEYHKPNRFTPKPAWLLYGASALGAYSLVNKNNPGRSFKSKHALRWAAGMGAGIAVHALIGTK